MIASKAPMITHLGKTSITELSKVLLHVNLNSNFCTEELTIKHCQIKVFFDFQ